jgi:hypothetical protein
VRMAWIELSRGPSFEAAVGRIREGLLKFLASIGAMGYHETVTVAFSRLIRFRMDRAPEQQSWPEFLAENGDLLSKSPPILSTYYSPERLESPEARATFLEPDRRPLPSDKRRNDVCPRDLASAEP